jgi:NAD(P)-dependent dehydrogenase (short-subunit alcohol dehydrogenase family)
MPPGQSILITDATSGIGRDAALRLARGGHLVLAGGRRPDALADALRVVPAGNRLVVAVLGALPTAAADATRRRIMGLPPRLRRPAG